MINDRIKDMAEMYSRFEEYESKIYRLDSSRFKKVLKTIMSLKKEIKKGRLLEIGCLSGKMLYLIKSDEWNCYGIDIIDRHDPDKDIVFITHDVEKGLPFTDNFFDIIYAGEVIEHMYDTDRFVNEIYRTLKPNGYVIITTPNIASLINRFLLLIGKFPRYVEYRKGGAGHIRFYTLKIIEEQLCDNEFKIIKRFGNFVSFPDPTRDKKIRNSILSFLGNYFPTFSENFIIVAKK